MRNVTCPCAQSVRPEIRSVARLADTPEGVVIGITVSTVTRR